MNTAIIELLRKRYFLSHEKTWEDIAKRVAKIYPSTENAILNMDFIPSSPTLMNACTGGERKGTLSSCFPMGIEDSIEGIYEALKESAIVTKFGGGVGYNFSTLRSSNENIKSLNRSSSGPIPFIKNFDVMLDGIQQGGVRRGAGMALLDITHPDILQFIRAKEDSKMFNRFNFSIKISDEFYRKLENTPQAIHQVCNKNGDMFDLLDQGKPITVKQLWDIIVEHSWKYAEPGIFNSDIAFGQCTVTNVSKEVLSNPCAEYISIPYSACSLGSINLSNCVSDGKFDWIKFEKTIALATRFLDATIDVNEFPLNKIRDTVMSIRPIGLGTMGLAHALYKMGIAYNSKQTNEFVGKLYRYLTLRSMKESLSMCLETTKGDVAHASKYPSFDAGVFLRANGRFFNEDCREISVQKLKQDIEKYGIHNSCFTSIAPTGSISFIANTSGGIEPVFALAYARKIEKLNKEYDIVYLTDPIFDEYLEKHFNASDKAKILAEVADKKGSCQSIQMLSDAAKKVFVTAGDLTPQEHLDVLGNVARNVSLSVSKTINIPSDAPKEAIADVFLKAHREGVIGVTVYRDGCREGILVHKNISSSKRPLSLECDIYKMNISAKTDKGRESQKWIAFIGLKEGRPYEVFAGKIDDVNLPLNITSGQIIKIKHGHYAFAYNEEILINNISKTFSNDEYDAFARVISISLRQNVPVEYIVDQLQKAKGSIVDWNKVISVALKKYIKNGTMGGTCSCGAKMIFTDGCQSCPNCGLSKCG